jgi:catechol 2,3-dioxygenase-like lactoylglutathione lyase family enzyme
MSQVQERTASTCCGPGASLQEAQDLPSAADFPCDKRPHISINVRSIRAALPFYSALFGARPTKLRGDYAKWEMPSPPINLAINEHPEAASRNGHFGIEVKSTDAVQAYHERLKRLRIPVDATEQNVACCFSVQTKIWASDPDGNHWEIFVVTQQEADEGCQSTCICYNPATGGCDWT